MGVADDIVPILVSEAAIDGNEILLFFFRIVVDGHTPVKEDSSLEAYFVIPFGSFGCSKVELPPRPLLVEVHPRLVFWIERNNFISHVLSPFVIRAY